MLQRSALPSQCSAATMICPGSFNGVAEESNRWQSLCPAGTIRQRFGSDEVLRRDVNISSGMTRIIFSGSGPRRIAVNVVAPGAIQTDFSGGMVRYNPEVNKRVADMTALGRAGLPDDVGRMIASLLSEDNRWVNAQRIEVSGGMSI
jgi:hypothetical protein